MLPCVMSFIYSHCDELHYLLTLSFLSHHFARGVSGTAVLMDPVSLGPFLQADHSLFSLCPCSRQHCASLVMNWKTSP